MPTSVAEAFSAVGLVRDGVLQWGTRPPEPTPGVYIVSLTDSLDGFDGVLVRAPLAKAVFEDWLQICPGLTLDDDRPTVEQLMDRVGRFWLSDEVILYIGLATSLSTRLGQYYTTPIGARRPHSGGYFLKLLSNLQELWVHYARTNDLDTAEDAMLRCFTEAVSEGSKRELFDPGHPFPFANLEWPPGVRKAHGLRGTREAPTTSATQSSTRRGQPARSGPSWSTRPEGQYRTQRVTAADLQNGQIRIPSTSTSSTKELFPPGKSNVTVILRGQSIDCPWDPRMGPDRQRSGVLRVGAVLRELVRQDEVLTAMRGEGGAVVMD